MTFITVSAISAGASIFSAFKSSRSNKKALDFQKKQLEFQRQQYERFQKIYGGIEENLGNYFNNLTASSFAERGLEEYEKQYTQSLENINEQLALSGIDKNSGVAQSIQANAELEKAENRAQIRSSAEQQVIQAKQGFVSSGQGTNNAQHLAGTYGDMANMHMGQSQAWGQAAGGFASSALQSGRDSQYQDFLKSLENKG